MKNALVGLFEILFRISMVLRGFLVLIGEI